MTDDRPPVILDTSAPPSPGYVLEVAEAIAEGVRVFNHRPATMRPWRTRTTATG